jgi:hypothetical protein
MDQRGCCQGLCAGAACSSCGTVRTTRLTEPRSTTSFVSAADMAATLNHGMRAAARGWLEQANLWRRVMKLAAIILAMLLALAPCGRPRTAARSGSGQKRRWRLFTDGRSDNDFVLREKFISSAGLHGDEAGRHAMVAGAARWDKFGKNVNVSAEPLTVPPSLKPLIRLERRSSLGSASTKSRYLISYRANWGSAGERKLSV